MYIPAHFSETDIPTLHALMAEHPFGLLITQGKQGLDANPLPFHLDTATGALGTLHCHVARNNTVWQDVASGAEVLVVFQAGDAYISPNWYPSKHETHLQVPTWNYRIIHARGRVTVHDDERYVRGVVGRLTRTHEAQQPAPWKMSDSPREWMDGMMKAIVGLEITITSLVGKSKLSQNKDTRDIEGAIHGLESSGETGISAAMRAALQSAVAPEGDPAD